MWHTRCFIYSRNPTPNTLDPHSSYLPRPSERRGEKDSPRLLVVRAGSARWEGKPARHAGLPPRATTRFAPRSEYRRGRSPAKTRPAVSPQGSPDSPTELSGKRALDASTACAPSSLHATATTYGNCGQAWSVAHALLCLLPKPNTLPLLPRPAKRRGEKDSPRLLVCWGPSSGCCGRGRPEFRRWPPRSRPRTSRVADRAGGLPRARGRAPPNQRRAREETWLCNSLSGDRAR